MVQKLLRRIRKLIRKVRANGEEVTSVVLCRADVDKIQSAAFYKYNEPLRVEGVLVVIGLVDGKVTIATDSPIEYVHNMEG